MTTASAQTYPQRPVRFILPFGPGRRRRHHRPPARRQAVDERWGKPVVVENRPGGDGLVAINAFTSANDDHTLLFVPASTFTAHPYTNDKLPYDAERDLVPIVNVTTIVIALACPGNSEREIAGASSSRWRAPNPTRSTSSAAAGNSDLILSTFIKTQNLPVTQGALPRHPCRRRTTCPKDRIQLLMSSLCHHACR